MLKWIKNNKGAKNNESTGYKGITINNKGEYKANISIRLSVGKGKPRELKNYLHRRIPNFEKGKKSKNRLCFRFALIVHNVEM